MDLKAFNFNEHPLQLADEHTQGLYLEFLLAVARADDNTIFYDKMVDLAARMMEKMSINLSLADIAKRAFRIDDSVLKEFSNTLKLAKLEQNFIVDAMMFSIILDGSSEKNLKYIVDIGSVLRLEQQQLKELMQLVKIILEQDKIAFKNMCYEVLQINVAGFMMYSKSFIDLYVINDLSVYSKVKYEYDNVVFANLDINGESLCDAITDIKKLLIINCNFTNSKSEYTIFDCGKIVIKHCKFTDFSNTALRIYDCEQLEIANCEFSNCIQDVDNGYCFDSATMVLSNMENVKISDCMFSNCHAIPQLSVMNMVMEPSAAIARLEDIQHFKLRDSKFINCISNKNFHEKGTLFVLRNTDCSKASSCNRNNCCDIGDERLGKW